MKECLRKFFWEKILTSLGGKEKNPQVGPLSWAQLAGERVEIPSDLTAHVMSTSCL